MGFIEALTLALIVLKLTGYIALTWFQVFIPLLAYLVMVLCIIAGMIIYKLRN